MKKDLLTVKELAAELRMSPKSIQRGYRKGGIPVQWMCRMARFDLAKVRRAMERKGRNRMRRLNGTSPVDVRMALPALEARKSFGFMV